MQNIPRSDSITTFSTFNSSQFTDAHSRFSDAASRQATEESGNIPKTETKQLKENSQEQKMDEVPIQQNEQGIKTFQPEKVKEPTTGLVNDGSSDPKPRGYQREHSECHQYFCNSYLLDILDLPNWKSFFCLCCTICCDSCCTGGVKGTATTNIKV